MKEQSRLSVMPRLSFNQSQSSNDSIVTFSYQLINKGLGPAIIDSIAIVYYGKTYPADFNEFFKEQIPKLSSITNAQSSTYLAKGGTLTPREEITLYKITFNVKRLADFLSLAEQNKIEEELDIVVFYSSIYKEQWKINVRSPHSIPEEI